jgi:uncharacterized membrane protein YbhN (UPF0104 family)
MECAGIVSKYIRIAVSVLLLSWIAYRTNWSEVGGKFASLRVEMWFAAVGLYMLAQFACARRWQLFSRELQFEHSLPQYCGYYFIGMFFSLLLPTSVGGDVMRVWYLNGDSGRKWAALASVFLERLNGLLILIAVACIGVVISPIAMPWWMVASVWGIAGAACLGLAATPLLQRWPRLSETRREQLKMFVELMRSPRMFIESTTMSILVQVAGVMILWCLGEALGLNVPVAYYCVLGPLVSLLMLLPISVNGMGVREGATVLLLAPVGVDSATALSLAFLWFMAGVAVSAMGGVVYLFGTEAKAEHAAMSNQVTVQAPG